MHSLRLIAEALVKHQGIIFKGPAAVHRIRQAGLEDDQLPKKRSSGGNSTKIRD